MKIGDLLKETTISLSMNRVRSGLTMLGIIIGVGAVVALISIGQGVQFSIEERIQGLGTNLLSIYPGAQKNFGKASTGRGSAQTLTIEDANAILENINHVQAVAPYISGNYQIIVKGSNTNTSVYGVSNSYLEVNNLKTSQGGFINEKDLNSMSKIAVLGDTTASDLFEKEDIIGKRIRINNLIFTVIGKMEEQGGGGFNNQDDRLYIPITSFEQYLSGADYVNNISVQVEGKEYMEATQSKIKQLLLARHDIENIENADFQIMNQKDMLETASSVSQTLTMFLGAIAGISLLVGGIGIMNMMLTTVTERIKEIGLRKSIGAKKKDISRQFLAESVTLTFLGGIIGIGLGWLTSILVAKFSDMQTVVTLQSIFWAFSISAIIGIVFGYYPAKKAARLNPIEALRYE